MKIKILITQAQRVGFLLCCDAIEDNALCKKNTTKI